MILFESPHHIVIDLNSGTVPAASILDGAIGRLGESQLTRLERLLQARPGKRAIVALHHHVGCPPKILAVMKVSSVELRALQLEDATRLRSILERHGSSAVFHGHKRVGYPATIGKTRIFSAPSVAYGNRAGADNCHVHALSPTGEVALVASTRIAA